MAHNQLRVLVTGGAGFIGSHLVDSLLDTKLEVTALDNVSTGRMKNLIQAKNRKNFRFIKGDIRDFETTEKAVAGADVVFHEAGLGSVARSVEDPVVTHDVNVTGTLHLLKASVDASVRRFIYASSSSVYGEIDTLPRSEDLALNPVSPYAVSKLAAENYVKVFHEVYGLETVCLRYFNVYGPRQAYGPYSAVITAFINRLASNQPPIIYGDGLQMRDFTNVSDVVEANLLAMTEMRANGEVFNIATGTATSINQLATALLQMMNKADLKPIHQDPRKGDIERSYADISKARRILGYKPKIGLKEGLEKLVEWFSESGSKARGI